MSRLRRAISSRPVAAGADDVALQDDGSIEVLTTSESFRAVVEAMTRAKLKPDHAEISQRAANDIRLGGDGSGRADVHGRGQVRHDPDHRAGPRDRHRDRASRGADSHPVAFTKFARSAMVEPVPSRLMPNSSRGWFARLTQKVR